MYTRVRTIITALLVFIALFALPGTIWAANPKVSAGERHILELKGNGTLWSWGYNDFGQLGDGSAISYKSTPAQIGTDADWSAVSAGQNHSLALKSDGSLWAWGYNYQGQLGAASADTTRNKPVRIGTDNDWAVISAGSNHSLALKGDGSLWAWGNNWSGQVGNGAFGNNANTNYPVKIGSDTDWVAIAGGYHHTVALKAAGSLWLWGGNVTGQLGDGTTTAKHVPTQFGSESNWSAISAGISSTFAVKNNGTLWAWGYNDFGQLGDSTTSVRYSPVPIGTDADWVAVSALNSHTLAQKRDGSLWAWGYNMFGTLGDGTAIAKNYPVRVGTDTDWLSFDVSMRSSFALKKDGSLWTWGQNPLLGIGPADKSVPVQIGIDKDWGGLDAGSQHVAALKNDGSLWAWGNNLFGQLGDGSNEIKATPEQSGSETSWDAVSAGYQQTLAVKSDGSLWSWGDNNGNSSTNDPSLRTPARIGSDVNWQAVSAGNTHSLALKSDGSLWGWGRNDYGQVGIGSNSMVASPAIIWRGCMYRWTSFGAGGGFSVALQSNGTLWSWGANSDGRLGDGTNINKIYPVRIGTDANWTALSVGTTHTAALKTDGSLWGWGNNGFGQLGDGTIGYYASKNAPVRIGNDSDWQAVAAGGGHTVALKRDGSLWAWGDNQKGQLGNGTIINSVSPIRIGDDTDWVTINAGDHYTIARKSNGALWAWGFNSYGQLGDNTAFRVSPGQVDYSITASAGTNGSISPSGYTTIPKGEGATFSISPKAGYRIADVIVDGISVGSISSYPFNSVTANHSISATFEPISYTLTITKSGTGSGLIASTDMKIDCGASCQYSYAGGTLVTLKITANNGSIITSWANTAHNMSKLTRTETFLIGSDTTINYEFTASNYAITTAPGPNTTITCLPLSVAHVGQSVCNIVADSGYGVADVMVDGVSVGTLNRYLFENVVANHTIAAIAKDVTPPVITGNVTALPNANGWYNSGVTVHFTATDTGSGMDTVTPDTTISQEGASQSVTGTAADKAGNKASYTVNGLNIDKTGPVIIITGVQDGAVYSIGSAPVPAYSANDYLSGIADQKATLGVTPNGVGKYTYTVTASDKAGNTSTKSVTYTISYVFGGFLPPVSLGKPFNQGSTIPVKFVLTNGNGGRVKGVAATIMLQKYSGNNPSGSPVKPSSSVGSNIDNLFREESGQYIYNLNTKELSSGSWQIVVTLGDGTIKTVFITLGKSGDEDGEVLSEAIGTGDLNGDGKVDVADALLVMRKMAGKQTTAITALKSGANTSEVTYTIQDAIKVLRKATRRPR